MVLRTGHPTCFDVMFGVGAPADGERHAPSETITHDKETKLRFNDFLLERGVHILDVSPSASYLVPLVSCQLAS